VLGCTREEDEALRNQMTGTPTVRGAEIDINSDWGQTCTTLLDAVRNHGSRASAGYYLKYYLQYFNSIQHSLSEINRTLGHGGKAVFVVQDSYYKEVHVDLPGIFTEMGQSMGWELTTQINYAVGSNLAAINPASREYRNSIKAVESALVFSKTGAA
jgi:hypothetical protein